MIWGVRMTLTRRKMRSEGLPSTFEAFKGARGFVYSLQCSRIFYLQRDNQDASSSLTNSYIKEANIVNQLFQSNY